MHTDATSLLSTKCNWLYLCLHIIIYLQNKHVQQHVEWAIFKNLHVLPIDTCFIYRITSCGDSTITWYRLLYLYTLYIQSNRSRFRKFNVRMHVFLIGSSHCILKFYCRLKCDYEDLVFILHFSGFHLLHVFSVFLTLLFKMLIQIMLHLIYTEYKLHAECLGGMQCVNPYYE